MSRVSNQTYFDTLCEEEQVLQETHKQLHGVLDILQKLGNIENSENEQAEQAELLKALSKEYQQLNDAAIDLRYVKYRAREVQVANSKSRRNDVHTKLQNITGLANYVTLIESINKDSLEYVNLLERLSVDLVKQIDIGDSNVSEFVVDRWNPPKEIFTILEDLGDPTIDPRDIRSRLERYLDQIKMERAKFTIQNKYSLQQTLRDLRKEVNTWRKEWDSMENLMFGDNSNSLKKMLLNVNTLRSKLDNEKQESQHQREKEQHTHEIGEVENVISKK